MIGGTPASTFKLLSPFAHGRMEQTLNVDIGQKDDTFFDGSVDSGELYNEAKPLRQTIPLSLVMAGVRAPCTTAGEAIEGEGWLLETSGCLIVLVSVQAGTRLPVLLDTIEIPWFTIPVTIILCELPSLLPDWFPFFLLFCCSSSKSHDTSGIIPRREFESDDNDGGRNASVPSMYGSALDGVRGGELGGLCPFKS